jgi:transposase
MKTRNHFEPRCRLQVTEQKVNRILDLHAEEGYSPRELASIVGVTLFVVRCVLHPLLSNQPLPQRSEGQRSARRSRLTG